VNFALQTLQAVQRAMPRQVEDLRSFRARHIVMQELKRLSTSMLEGSGEEDLESKRSRTACAQIMGTAAEVAERPCTCCRELEGRLVDLQVMPHQLPQKQFPQFLHLQDWDPRTSSLG
jgi:hypothetical protein